MKTHCGVAVQWNALRNPAGLRRNWNPNEGNTDESIVCGVPPESAAAPDWINDGYDTANRYTGNPANIRAVGINIVARSTETVPDKAGDRFPSVLANRTPPPADPKPYTRAVLSITEQTANLLSRARLVPAVGGG